MDKVRVLFLPTVDAGNVNAQSLNVREITLRLDPEQFLTTLWYEAQPDPRLLNRPAIRLERLPRHGRTLRILKEMMSGYHIIAYIDYSPASYAFLHLPRFLRGRTKSVLHLEAPSAQMVKASRTLRFLYDGIFPRCDVYTGITEFVASDVQKSIGKKASHILPVGVDTNLFTPPQSRSNAAPVVLFAGTLIERKGPQLMLDAAERFPHVEFHLVGASREGFGEFLQQRIAASGLSNVKFDGPRSQLELAQIMRASDIFMLPSRLEGIPKVTLEAAATGLPSIVFRDYETPSVVDGITGFQVKTTEEMIQALGRLLSDSSLRQSMGQAARKHVESFRWDIVSQQWQDAYLEIAASRK